MLAQPADQQIYIDRSAMPGRWPTSGRGSGVVGYNVQVAVDTRASSDRHA